MAQVHQKKGASDNLFLLKRDDFWDLSKWLAGAYKSSASHQDHLQKPVLIRDEKIKWLDFSMTLILKTCSPILAMPG